MPKNRAQYERQRAYRELRRQALECTAMFVRSAVTALEHAEAIAATLPGTAQDTRVQQDVDLALRTARSTLSYASNYAQNVALEEIGEE